MEAEPIKLDRKEFEEIASQYPDYESDPRFRLELINTLIYNVMKRLYPYSEDSSKDLSWVMDEIARIEVLSSPMVKGEYSPETELEDLLKDSTLKEEVKVALSIEKELRDIGDYEKISSWSQNHVPPIEFTKWDHGFIKLCALRGYKYKIEKGMNKNASTEIN